MITRLDFLTVSSGTGFMTTTEKAKAVRDVLRSNPRNAGPEFDSFRTALRDSLDKPVDTAMVDELYAALPR